MTDELTLETGREPLSEFEDMSVSGWAKASLIMGILGLIALPVVGSILAIVFARIAKKRILYDDNLSGDGLATAGQTLGIIGLVLAAIGLYVLLDQQRLKNLIGDFFQLDTIRRWWP